MMLKIYKKLVKFDDKFWIFISKIETVQKDNYFCKNALKIV